MKLHELTTLRTRKTQRIGRSGKRGSYSGRGQKGQRSRSGHRIRPAERDIILKLPKLRGFRNKQKDENPEVFNLGTISKKFAPQAKAGTPLAVDRALLQSAKLIRKDYKGIVKILGTGEIAFPVAVKGFQVSAGAKAKIEKAGGSVL
ncbi:MAG: uL15 family ribosomal protein [Candidatus Pacebacteria bacterium]|nr:uL15 family ribosomal protein [Candidatus Paceibacterota bacterium]